MKDFLKIVAWTGIALMSVATVIMFNLSWEYSHYIPSPYHTDKGLQWFYVPLLDIIALASMLVGGIKTRPKYFWIPCVVTGVLSILSYYGYAMEFINILHEALFGGTSLLFLSFAVIPGIIAIVEGLILRTIKKAK